ncbi:pyridoxal phosphate-dependent transferase [Ephemerocybe angulata]|uniref:Pyridoxal phosphate-dependent transferase n=1 Tax=Ephemerocybe angulata TaxID=980116 RepID=A0A8H6HTP7_9AGAR|nr:pyridoxal phosphate-dependent transferase [Tulosesus angulatus]
MEPTLSQFAETRRKDGLKVKRHEEVMSNAFSESNPEGLINLAVAENSLMTGYLMNYFKEHFSLRPLDFTYGDSLAGNLRLRTSLAQLFNVYFKPFKPVSAYELMAGGGLLPIIGQLGRALVDPGNAILIARPYYHGFDMALGALDNIKVQSAHVPLHDAFTTKELDHLELALREAGTKVQAVFLVNPQNPYGRCYPKEVLEAYCRFCEQHDLHLVSDEIYALSSFCSRDVPTPQPFISILSLDLDSLGVKESRVHMLYGMSKDFDANGFRAGVLHTRNRTLYQSLLATSIFSIVSSPTAELWNSLLSDERGLEAYIEANRAALVEAYEHITEWLRFHDIPYIPSSAGHFLMVNFRPLLSQDSMGHVLGYENDAGMAARETALLSYLSRPPCRVVLAPASGMHMFEPGWFRLTFSISRGVMDIALGKIERALGWKRWSKPSSQADTVDIASGVKGNQLN